MMAAKTYFEAREASAMASKRAVAKHVVANFLHEGDSILLDAGTSSYPIAEEIAAKAQSDPESTHYTIMTHNYKAFQILVDKIPREAMVNIVLTGGRYDRDLNALFGPQTIMIYERFFPRVVLVAVSALRAKDGLFCHGNTEELEVKKLIFKKPARDRIIIADYTKFGLSDALSFGETSELRDNVEECILVTDEPGANESDLVKKRFERERAHLIGDYRVKVEIAKVAPEMNAHG